MRNMRQKMIAFIMTIAAVMGFTVPASADDAEPFSCGEVGVHQQVSGLTAVFIPGALPKTWLDPGGVYRVSKAKTTKATGSVSGGVDAQFSSFVKVHISATLAVSNTVSETQGWSWKNTSNTLKWGQLGARGYRFTYTRYDVVPPCTVKNRVVKYATMPTKESWLHHN